MNYKTIFHTLKSSFPVVIAGAMFASCNGEGPKPSDAPAALTVDVVVAQPRAFQMSLEATGNIRPFEEVELRAPVGGTVLEILFEEGQPVQKGDLLIRLDDRAWQAEARGLRVRIEAAKSDLQRKQELLKIEGASQEEADAARATLAGLEAQLDQLEVNISLANVKAPFTGVVGLRDFSLGTYLPAGGVITRLAQVDRLKLDFDIPGKYADRVVRGKHLRVISGRDTATATVYAVNPSVDNASRNLEARAVMDGNRRGFTPGDFARVVFPLEMDSNAILVPTDAIVPELNGQTAFVLRGGKVHKQNVVLGSRTAQEVQVVEGISTGDSVIVSGLLQVKEGMKVNASIQPTK